MIEYNAIQNKIITENKNRLASGLVQPLPSIPLHKLLNFRSCYQGCEEHLRAWQTSLAENQEGLLERRGYGRLRWSGIYISILNYSGDQNSGHLKQHPIKHICGLDKIGFFCPPSSRITSFVKTVWAVKCLLGAVLKYCKQHRQAWITALARLIFYCVTDFFYVSGFQMARWLVHSTIGSVFKWHLNIGQDSLVFSPWF